MKPKISALLAVVGLWLTTTALAALSPEAEQDLARWRSITLFAQRFDPPPDGWRHVDDDKGHLSFSMPCEPRVIDQNIEDVPLRIYLCHTDTRVYQVMIAYTGNVMDPDWLEAYWVGQDQGMTNRFKEAAGAVTLRPRLRIAYEGGLSGRQQTFEFGDKQMEVRCLAGKRVAITLMLMYLKSSPQGDLYDFFNSLRMN
jgi:hypothetical protein